MDAIDHYEVIRRPFVVALFCVIKCVYICKIVLTKARYLINPHFFLYNRIKLVLAQILGEEKLF
jgi:hypothetical protein